MNASDIAHMLGGKRSGRQYLCRCPAHDDASPSLLVFDGHTDVQVRCQAGCEPIEVLRAINAMSGGGYNREAFVDTSKQAADDAAEARRHAELAMSIFSAAVDPRGTMGEMYLWDRGLVLPDGDPTHVVRFHPACMRGHSTQPALVVLMRECKSNKPRAIQRIFLKQDDEHGRIVKDGAMMLGPAGGCGMKLTSHSATFWDHMNWCPCLYACEGFETGLALLQRGRKPVWALGSAGAVQRFLPLFGIGHVVICADHDEAGLQAANECRELWGQHRAEVWVPPMQGTDFADLERGDG